jgi:3-phenylpropionate/cinnamic acid dioxygenase small subunit
MYQYAHALDYGQREEFLDCFTETGMWESRRQDAQRTLVGSYTGWAALGSFFDRHTHAPETYHKHLLAEPSITVSGDEAHALSSFWRVDDYRGDVYVPGFGRYMDRLIRCPDGRWRFAERHVQLESWNKRGA